MLPLVDAFRIVNWRKIESDLQFGGFWGLFPEMTLQN